MSETLETLVPSQATPNPLLMAWQTPFETPPFAEIAPEHFLPAFEQAFADHTAEITAITYDPSVPDFANTITALERAGKLLSKVSAVFYDLVSAHSNPTLLEIDKEVSLRMARHWNPIMMNAVLFGRIALLHDNRATLELSPEQNRLLERTYTRFHRAGAGLDEAAKNRMAEINERLAHLGTAFSHHLLGDEQDWFMELGEADCDGLPDSFVAAAKAAAQERGMAGKAIAVGLAEFHEPVLLIAEQMVAERRAEMRQPLVDLGHPVLGGFVEPGAGAVEARIGPLQEPRLLGREPERGLVAVQQRDPAEQHRIHHDRVPVPRHPQRHFLVDLEIGRA